MLIIKPFFSLSVISILIVGLLCGCSKEEIDIPDPEPVFVQTGTINKTVSVNGVERTYILYVPESYDGSKATSLIFNLHGYQSNATDQMRYGDFRPIADREGIIIAHGQGLDLDGRSHWNVGSWTTGSTSDDIGFISAMIDEISTEYRIDSRSVYSTGMSNGGYMSFLLACQLGDKIAAIASVTGSMTPENFDLCNPSRSIPILQIHGTNDGTVPYGGAIWTKSIDDVLNYWIGENNIVSTNTEMLSDSDTSDGSTVERIQHNSDGVPNMVVHYKITGGDHTWPGTVFKTPGTNNDFDASEAIWEFFQQHKL